MTDLFTADQPDTREDTDDGSATEIVPTPQDARLHPLPVRVRILPGVLAGPLPEVQQAGRCSWCDRPAAGPIVTYLGLEHAACAEHARRYARKDG